MKTTNPCMRGKPYRIAREHLNNEAGLLDTTSSSYLPHFSQIASSLSCVKLIRNSHVEQLDIPLHLRLIS